jgi:hypothetical protein
MPGAMAPPLSRSLKKFTYVLLDRLPTLMSRDREGAVFHKCETVKRRT